jgi:hypothetical protein
VQSTGGGGLEVVFKAKMLFVEIHRSIKIGNMDSDMVDALEHDMSSRSSKDRLSNHSFASVLFQCEKSLRRS